MKTLKKILLAIITLPFLATAIVVNLLWIAFAIPIVPFAVLFTWLKDDYMGYSSDWWLVFIIPFSVMYLDFVWDIDLV